MAANNEYKDRLLTEYDEARRNRTMRRTIMFLALALLLALASTALAEAGSSWTCPECGTENTWNFCTGCGTARPVRLTCPGCGLEIDADSGFSFCPNCGASLAEASEAEGSAEPSLAAEPVSGLWGRTVTPELLELPEEAYASADSMLVGLSEDGSRALITTPGGPHYVWVAETGEQIPLHFAPETKALLRGRAANLLNLDQAASDALLEKLDALSETDLVDFWLSMRHPDGYGYLSFCALVQGDYIGAQDRTMGGVLVADLRDGTLCGWLSDGTESIRDGRALLRTPPAQLEWMDLSTGAIEPASFDFHSPELPFEDYAVMAIQCLDDGGVCAVLRDIQLDLANGEECAFILQHADGTMQTYGLGRIPFGKEPDLIFAVPGANCFVLSSRTHAIQMVPYLIDSESGEVSLLTLGSAGFVRMPVQAAADTAPENEVWVPVTAMADGETVLVLDGRGEITGLALLRPDTLEYQTIVTPEQNDALGLKWLIGMETLVGNGRDCFHSGQAWFGDDPRAYLHFKVE